MLYLLFKIFLHLDILLPEKWRKGWDNISFQNNIYVEKYLGFVLCPSIMQILSIKALLPSFRAWQIYTTFLWGTVSTMNILRISNYVITRTEHSFHVILSLSFYVHFHLCTYYKILKLTKIITSHIYTKMETIRKIAIKSGTINWSGGYNYFISLKFLLCNFFHT